MQRFRAGDLTFTAPESWHETTLGQFLTLIDSEAPDDPYFVITTLSDLTEEQMRSQKAPFNFSVFVSKYLAFTNELPEPPAELPKTLTIDGKAIKLPSDLGAEATLGQMWDVELAIREREKHQLPVTPMAMASVLLPVFLWPLLRDEPYTDRYQAAELWPTLSKLPCIEGLATAAFFLASSLAPSNSGKISVTSLPQKTTGWNGLRLLKRLAWPRIKRSLQLSN